MNRPIIFALAALLGGLAALALAFVGLCLAADAGADELGVAA